MSSSSGNHGDHVAGTIMGAGNLDPIVSDEILDLLEDLTYSMGSAVLMSTHDFPLIQPRERRFIEMAEGRQVIIDI